MRYMNSAAALLLAAFSAYSAETYHCTFDSKIPPGVDCLNIDGGELAAADYRLTYDAGVSWVWGKMDAKNGAALCPTRNADGSTRVSRIVFPSVAIDSDEAIVRWDARSALSRIPESYKVLLKVAGAEEWTTLASINGENYSWTTRYCALADYVGKEVQIAIETSSDDPSSYMLVIDDVAIGVMDDEKIVYEGGANRHFFSQSESEGGETGYNVEFTNYGKRGDYTFMFKLNGAESYTKTYPDMKTGETFVDTYCEQLASGEFVDYECYLVAEGEESKLLRSDFYANTGCRRTILLDRFTGTWCNNCPQMEITLGKYRAQFNSDVIILDYHVNDPFQCMEYWADYGSECVFDIPKLVVAHNQTTASTVTEKRDKAYYDEFRAPALAGISAEVNFKNDGTAAVKAQIAPLEDFDNADDRYRLGYLIVADVYDPENVYIYQKNSASSPSWEEFYYMPNRILAKDVFFSNLIVEASTGVHGVAGSLADGKTAHEYELVVPEDYRRFPLKLVAMLIDNSDGRVVNCCFAKDNSTHAAPMILPDEANNAVYDLQGRRVDSQRDIAPGIYIKNRQKYIIK